MSDKRLLLTTAGSREQAQNLAHELVSRRLAACVNVIGPMTSVYRWQGKVDTAEEFLLLIKTTAAEFAAIRDALLELHSYELPELLQLPIETGLAEYLDWIGESVGED
ncbi:MAG TPA: divalent-cation tolerance protein CutA [Candidatus Acidoferrales bacterium]|jgi:periplasmic divalent cation tolerance protein|nr:divalent-cation tolerance protein CutA [Candidatus Acidoferrales bacterium]